MTFLSRLRVLPVFLFITLFLPMLAFAQEVAGAPVPVPSTTGLSLLPFDATDPASVAKMLMDALVHKQWGIVVSLVITVAIAMLRKFTPEESKFGLWMRSKLGALILNFGFTLGSAFVTLFLAGGSISLELILKAVTVALTASGGWSMFKALSEAIQEKKAQAAGVAAEADPKKTINL